MDAEAYRRHPGRTAATAFWKIASGLVPSGVRVVHADDDAASQSCPMPGRAPERHFKPSRPLAVPLPLRI